MRHRTVSGITERHRRRKTGEREHTLSYFAVRNGIRIIELESRCAIIRTVGSNPTLSANCSVMRVSDASSTRLGLAKMFDDFG
jgi:hypothetical protein